jgi:hypothetical protein
MNKLILTCLAAIAGCFASVASPCLASSITYSVDLTVGAGSVTGDIITDGTVGVLNCLGCGRSNILDWNLVLNDSTTLCGRGQPCTIGLFGPNGIDGIDGYQEDIDLADNLSATATQLLFDFSGTADGDFFLENSYGALCFQTGSNCILAGSGDGVAFTMDPALDGIGDAQLTNLSGTQVIGTAISASSNVLEPDSVSLLGSGLLGLGLLRLWQRRGQQVSEMAAFP